MRGWLRQTPALSMAFSRRLLRGILVSIQIRFSNSPIHEHIAYIRALGNGDASGDSTAPIRNIMQSLPPLLSTIQEQTGITPPSWLAQMPNGHYDGSKMAKTTSE